MFMKQVLKYILSQVTQSLHFAESKHNISITLSSAIIVFAATQLSNFTLLGAVFSSIAITFCAISIFCSFFALTSKRVILFRNSGSSKNARNLLFYLDITKFDEATFIERVVKDYSLPKSYKADGFDFDLAHQIIATSKVARSKFRLFNLALFCLAVAIAFVVTSIIVSQVLK